MGVEIQKYPTREIAEQEKQNWKFLGYRCGKTRKIKQYGRTFYIFEVNGADLDL